MTNLKKTLLIQLLVKILTKIYQKYLYLINKDIFVTLDNPKTFNRFWLEFFTYIQIFNLKGLLDIIAIDYPQKT
jgi:hypothetical protein